MLLFWQTLAVWAVQGCQRPVRTCKKLGDTPLTHVSPLWLVPHSSPTVWLCCCPAGVSLPNATQAHEDLISVLQDMQTWEERSKKSKELLKEMMVSRREASELGTKYDTR